MSRCFADCCGSHIHRWWITNAAHVCSDFKVACTYRNCSQREQIRNDQKLELHTCVCLYMQACPCVLECIWWMFSLEFLWISCLKRVSNSFSLLSLPPCSPQFLMVGFCLLLDNPTEMCWAHTEANNFTKFKASTRHQMNHIWALMYFQLSKQHIWSPLKIGKRMLKAAT